jgi:hypothetical protein
MRDVAKVLRSKNAGPFLVTIDVMFDSIDDFELVQSSNALGADKIARAYGIAEEDVKGPYFQREALGAKVTVPKIVSAQDPFCPDLMGCNEHLPVAGLRVDA